MPLPLNSSVIDDILGPAPTALPRPKPRPSTNKLPQLASTSTSQPEQRSAASGVPRHQPDQSLGSTRDDPIILFSPDLSPIALPPEEHSHSTSSFGAADDSGVSLPGPAGVSKESGSPEGGARTSNAANRVSDSAGSNIGLPSVPELFPPQGAGSAKAITSLQGQPRESGSSSSGAIEGVRSSNDATRRLAQTFPPPPSRQPHSTGDGGVNGGHANGAPQHSTSGQASGSPTTSPGARPRLPQSVGGSSSATGRGSLSPSTLSSTQPPQAWKPPSTHAAASAPSTLINSRNEVTQPSSRDSDGMSGVTPASTGSQISKASEFGYASVEGLPPALSAAASQLSPASIDTTMNEAREPSSAAPTQPTQPPQALGRLSNQAPSTSSSLPLQPTQRSSGSLSGEAAAPPPVPLSRAGDPLWTANQDSALLETIKRQGTRWKRVFEDYNATSTQPRGADALRHRWRHLVQHGRWSPQLAAAKRAAKSTVRAKGPNAWTDEEEQVVRDGLAAGKLAADIYAEYKQKFGVLARSESALRNKMALMSKTEHFEGQEQSEDEEDEGDEEEEEDDDIMESQEGGRGVNAGEDIDMAEVAPSSEPRLTNSGHYMWTDEDDEVLLATVTRYRTQCIDWSKVERRYNRHCALQRSRPALQARWHIIKDKQPRRGQQQEPQAKKRQAGVGQGEGGGGGRGRAGGRASSAVRPLSRHRFSPMGSQTQDSQSSLVGFFKQSSLSAFPLPATPHQPTATARVPGSSFPSTAAAAPHHPSALSSILDTLSLSVNYEPNGVRISNVIPGLEVLVFSRKSVKLSLSDPTSSFTTSPSSSFEEQPAFHLKVLSDGSVQAVRSPLGASLGAGLARKEDGGVGTMARCVGVDGFSVSLIS